MGLHSGLDSAEPVSHVSIDWREITAEAHDVSVAATDAQVSIETMGEDPFFWFEMPAIPTSDRDWMLSISYFCPQGVSGIQWRTGRPARADGFVDLPAMAPAEGWTEYVVNLSQLAPEAVRSEGPVAIRLDLGNHAGVKLMVRGVRLRPMNDHELTERREAQRLRREKIELANHIRRYQQKSWDAVVERVRARRDQLIVTGRWLAPASPSDSTPEDSKKNVFLIPRFPESISAERPDSQELKHRYPVEITASGRFSTEVPVDAASELRLPGVRWQLIRLVQAESLAASKPISPARAVDLPVVRDRTTRPVSEVAKGLTCITSRFEPQTLRELGLTHGSVNILLSGLISDSPRPGWVPRRILNRRWWVNEQRLSGVDRNVLTGNAAGMQMAAILLIRPHGELAHPQAVDAGTYAMPDLTTRPAVAAYRAVLHLLAERYGQTKSMHGRIDHWIVHNEVDYGWQWTNMGQQPMEVFMDHYERSMRLVDQAVRTYNPDGRAFISLTHRWNVPDDRPWKTYAPRDMLNWLIRQCELEGDYPWGVAYHPYPESLWRADTWNDTQVTDAFETRLITLKNLTVLDRFLHQDRCRFADGAVRPVLCSEQGFHADVSDAEQLRQQAAALLYAWEKLRQCPSIIAFDYHRPSDHPDEGGLRLGLRGLPTSDDPLGKPKPAWEVYRAIGTAGESDWRQQLSPLWQTPTDDGSP
ncbi:DUF5722 domain-containing protein [Roseiconus nitratireducens]|uniref:DUF5722 domain-containing protein n=1 Tax=Roseiconus nitratireducens TaxID=2605748 RepID=UPI0013763D20|nr:DUF5722 domain-containing protein [Roseiconus nitratireducens]